MIKLINLYINISYQLRRVINMKPNKIIKNRLITTLIFFPLVIISGLLIIYSYVDTPFTNTSFHTMFKIRQYLGIIGIVILAVSIALYFIRLILRYSNPNGINKIDKFLGNFKLSLPKSVKEDFLTPDFLSSFRKFIGFFANIIQKFHIPFAMLGFAIIMYHVYIAYEIGWKWTIGYSFGLLAAIDLLFILFAGIARIWNKSIKLHKYLGFLFIIFTILHILTIKG